MLESLPGRRAQAKPPTYSPLLEAAHIHASLRCSGHSLSTCNPLYVTLDHITLRGLPFLFLHDNLLVSGLSLAKAKQLRCQMSLGMSPAFFIVRRSFSFFYLKRSISKFVPCLPCRCKSPPKKSCSIRMGMKDMTTGGYSSCNINPWV